MKDQKRGNGVGLFWICFLCAAVIVAAAVLTIWGGDGLLSGLSGNEAKETAALAESTDGGTGETSVSLPEEEADKEAEIVIRNEDGKETAAAPEPENGEAASADREAGNGQEAVTLAFAGDVYLSDHVLNAYENGGIGGVLGESLRQAAEEADLFMVNQEFPFSTRGTPAPDKQYTFRLPPERVSIFHEMGIDLVTLANNHALDYGTEALLDTCSTLEGAGIPYVGAGENLDRAKAMYTAEIKGRTIGFLGATRVIPTADWAASASRPGMLSTYDPGILLEEIRKGRENCDYLVVYIHWGIERNDMPEEYQRQIGKQCIDAGADLVIGSHPHVLQGIEYYNGKPIVYSLGNYVFGSSIPRTVLLNVQWEGENTSLSVIPATSGAGYTREITEEGARQEVFSYLESISFGAQVDENGAISPKTEETPQS